MTATVPPDLFRQIVAVEAQVQCYGSFDATPEPLLDRLAVLPTAGSGAAAAGAGR